MMTLYETFSDKLGKQGFWFDSRGFIITLDLKVAQISPYQYNDFIGVFDIFRSCLYTIQSESDLYRVMLILMSTKELIASTFNTLRDLGISYSTFNDTLNNEFINLDCLGVLPLKMLTSFQNPEKDLLNYIFSLC